jgi:diacylglycerol kinase
MFLLASIGLVLGAELVNTAFEHIADEISKTNDRKAGVIKDLGAGMVLICSITAAIIGCIIFIPYMIDWAMLVIESMK